MTTEFEHNDFKESSEIKQSLRGKISIAFGIFHLLISIAIFWALRSYINQEFVESLYLQMQILNIGSKIELFTKPVGFLIGIAGIFEKNVKKTTVFYGILINGLVLLWTIAVFAGLVI